MSKKCQCNNCERDRLIPNLILFNDATIDNVQFDRDPRALEDFTIWEGGNEEGNPLIYRGFYRRNTLNPRAFVRSTVRETTSVIEVR